MVDSAVRHRLPVRKLVAASVGNALEWFDWTIYATFSIYFATAFFPAGNDALAQINTFATYALAFFFRPLGGILLGRFADLRGRKPAMVLTIVMMAAGSVLIGVFPTFEQVGWLAPIGLLLARIVQGLSLGGEVSNASAYLGEIAPNERRGRYSAFFYISTGSAVLLASVLGFVLVRVLSEDSMQSWGWRLPFILGGVLGLIGLWLRRSLAETELFEEHKTERVPHPLRTTLREHPKAVGQLIGFTMLSTLCYYTFFSALTPFAVKTRGADAVDVFLALSIATALFVALQYPMGAIADRFGRKPQLLVWSAGDGRADRSAVHSGQAWPAEPGGGVHRRSRPLHRDDLDRARAHERAVPHRPARTGHRRLVQPHRGDLRRHGPAADQRPVQRGPGHRLLLVRGCGRRDRLRRHPHPARDTGHPVALTRSRGSARGVESPQWLP